MVFCCFCYVESNFFKMVMLVLLLFVIVEFFLWVVFEVVEDDILVVF